MQARGWCAGAGFGGPARTAEVKVDGVVVATGVADEARKLAGLHGFSIPFDCSTLSEGNHSVAFACRCVGSSSPPDYELKSSPQCTTAGPPVHVVPCAGDA